MKPAIQCRYSCSDCGLKDVVVTVAARAPGEDILHWMERVCLLAIAQDHSRRSPACLSTKMDELKIPIREGVQIGEA